MELPGKTNKHFLRNPAEEIRNKKSCYSIVFNEDTSIFLGSLAYKYH